MSQLQDTIALYRKRLFAQEALAHSTLDAAYRSILVPISAQFEELYQAIEIKALADGKVPISWLYEANRLSIIKQIITQQIDYFAALSLTQTNQMQYEAVSLGSESSQAMLRALVPRGISWSFGIPSLQAIAAYVGSLEVDSPLRKLFEGFGRKAARRVVRTLMNALTLGYNPKRIASMVAQDLDVPRQRASMIARNEMLRSYKGAALETYRANSDVCDKWIWHSTLNSARTCITCIAMHGTEHSLSEELNGHVVCRCARIPLTKSWNDILGPLGIDTSNIDDTRPKIQSGIEWFNKQNVDVQRKALGDAKYEAWKDGKFELDDVVQKTHDKEWGTSVQEKPLKELVK